MRTETKGIIGLSDTGRSTELAFDARTASPLLRREYDDTAIVIFIDGLVLEILVGVIVLAGIYHHSAIRECYDETTIRNTVCDGLTVCQQRIVGRRVTDICELIPKGGPLRVESVYERVVHRFMCVVSGCYSRQAIRWRKCPATSSAGLPPLLWEPESPPAR